MTNTIKWDKPCYKCLSHLCDLSCKKTSKTEEQDDEVLGFNGWGFPIEKPSQPEQRSVSEHLEPVACIEDEDLYFANEIDWQTLQQQLMQSHQTPLLVQNAMRQAMQRSTEVAKMCQAQQSLQKPIPQDAKLYTTPPQRTWVGLTDEEIDLLEELYAPPVHPDFVKDADHCLELIRHVEAKLKEKNT